MSQAFYSHLQTELDGIRAAGLFKAERIITTPQGAVVKTTEGREVINLCANNYLGLSSHPKVIEAAHEALRTHGFGLSSVRFICGTQDLHKELEQRIARFVGCEDAILYAAAFDANGGLFEPLLGEQDAIISDALNHASIIDGIRLCKAQRYRYEHNNLADLERCLKEAEGQGRPPHAGLHRRRVLDGRHHCPARQDPRPLRPATTRCSVSTNATPAASWASPAAALPEHCGVFGKIDIITGTFGKALGGASGGFTAARKEVVELLRQRSRPYLFSNTLAPSIAGASLAVLDLLEASTALRDKLEANTAFFREAIQAAGFEIKPGTHPIVPIMVYDAVMAQKLSARILELGLYAVGFFFPVVPKGQARIRVQISAVHEREHLEKAVAAFTQAGKELGIIKN